MWLGLRIGAESLTAQSHGRRLQDEPRQSPLRASVKAYKASLQRIFVTELVRHRLGEIVLS